MGPSLVIKLYTVFKINNMGGVNISVMSDGTVSHEDSHVII